MQLLLITMTSRKVLAALQAQEQQQQQGASKPMRVNRWDDHAKVDRIIKTHFSTWSRQDTDSTVREGSTLRAALLAVVEGLEVKGRVSLKVIASLQARFVPVGSTSASLQVMDSTAPIDRTYLSALTLATHSNPAKRSRSQLQAFLQSGQRLLNQRELVALLRSLDGVNVVTDEAMRSHVLIVMDHLENHHFRQTHGQEMGLMKRLFDETLCAVYAQMKRERLGLELFWARYGALVPLIADPQEFATIINESRSWMHVKAELERCTARTRLPKTMFGGAAEMLAIESYTLAVALMNMGVMTMAGSLSSRSSGFQREKTGPCFGCVDGEGAKMGTLGRMAAIKIAFFF